ncbi:MAG TPA: S8 family peptidase, partial [Bryobacteraceae bacterium]|nr:S8 family peptidase [Bryobacteraceae bacterium]
MPQPKKTKSSRNKGAEQPIRIAVKLNDRAPKGLNELGGLEKYLDEKSGHSGRTLRLLPLIESVDPKRLGELIDKAWRSDPQVELPHFSAWYQIICPPGIHPDELAKALRELDTVETAYVMRPGPPPVNPGDDPRNTNQGYLDAAPNGIDARYAWGFAGGDGAGIGFVDMEQGWNLNHEDLAAAGITLLSGINNTYFYHGTSVLGEVLMVDNTVGGVGVAPSASGRVVSQQRTAASYNTPDAILSAVTSMSFGDVLLLEAQEYDPVGLLYYWPVEIADATFDAIRLATALGVVVIEAGCNGSYDLDAYTNLSGKKIFDRTSADFHDSGAIMVGAGSSASPHTRLSFSNHGNRIDCYGWGENIDTTTTNAAGTDNTAYTTGFNGTSGASPIVTGAALIVQGLARASLGYRFSPLELRRILTTNGTPSATPATDGIGVMPNLRAIITGHELNLAPDLFLRDYVGDLGDPTSGIVSQSPDIIVRQAAVADPQAIYGASSGTENDPSLSQDVDTGHPNFVYVRLLNRGGSPATGVSVDVYWSPPATLVTPNLWTLIGTATLPSVPTGNVLTVSSGITWPSAALPGPGHYCFVAVVGSVQDPKPGLAAFSTFNQYVAFIENNNNVAWRNFDVVIGPPSSGAPPGFYRLPFLIPGAFDTSHVFELETLGRLPERSRAFLEVPEWLADALRPHPCEIKRNAKSRTARIPLHPTGVQRLG